VVNRDLPPRVIAAGNPAKVIREIEFQRSEEEEVVD
jgi:acetyltransferase-like isoleucine patch superfamily enzyme